MALVAGAGRRCTYTVCTTTGTPSACSAYLPSSLRMRVCREIARGAGVMEEANSCADHKRADSASLIDRSLVCCTPTQYRPSVV